MYHASLLLHTLAAGAADAFDVVLAKQLPAPSAIPLDNQDACPATCTLLAAAAAQHPIRPAAAIAAATATSTSTAAAADACIAPKHVRQRPRGVAVAETGATLAAASALATAAERPAAIPAAETSTERLASAPTAVLQQESMTLAAPAISPVAAPLAESAATATTASKAMKAPRHAMTLLQQGSTKLAASERSAVAAPSAESAATTATAATAATAGGALPDQPEVAPQHTGERAQVKGVRHLGRDALHSRAMTAPRHAATVLQQESMKPAASDLSSVATPSAGSAATASRAMKAPRPAITVLQRLQAGVLQQRQQGPTSMQPVPALLTANLAHVQPVSDYDVMHLTRHPP